MVRDLIDLIKIMVLGRQTMLSSLLFFRKIPPRLYSIASSYEANPDEVHLTIGALRYDSHGTLEKWCLFRSMCRTIRAWRYYTYFYSTQSEF